VGRYILVKLVNVKFKGNPFTCSRVVVCVQTDMAELRGYCCNFSLGTCQEWIDLSRTATIAMPFQAKYNIRFLFRDVANRIVSPNFHFGEEGLKLDLQEFYFIT
jgi:hypothetical protein